MENEFADDALHGSVDDEDEDEDEDEDDIPQNVREGWAVCGLCAGPAAGERSTTFSGVVGVEYGIGRKSAIETGIFGRVCAQH